MPGEWKNVSPSDRDIVTAYFPETKPKGAIELRPCLVLDVYVDEDADISNGEARYAARIAYGTKNLGHKNLERSDLVIQNHADMDAMGLAYATRFSLTEDSIVVLAWDETNFGCWRGYSTPAIGFLDDDYGAMLDRRLAKQAELSARRA